MAQTNPYIVQTIRFNSKGNIYFIRGDFPDFVKKITDRPEYDSEKSFFSIDGLLVALYDTVSLVRANGTTITYSVVTKQNYDAYKAKAEQVWKDFIDELQACCSSSSSPSGPQSVGLTGDVTGSGETGTPFETTIANQAVTFAKMQNINNQRIIGRSVTPSTPGSPEEISVGPGLLLDPATKTLSAVSAPAQTYTFNLALLKYTSLSVPGFVTGVTNDTINLGPNNSVQNSVLSGLAGGALGRIVTIRNITPSSLIIIESQGAAATAGQAFFNPSRKPIFLYPGDTAQFIYFNSQWQYMGLRSWNHVFDTYEDFFTAIAPLGGSSVTSAPVGGYYFTFSGTGSGIQATSIPGTPAMQGYNEIYSGPATSRWGTIGSAVTSLGLNTLEGYYNWGARVANNPKNPSLLNNGTDLYRIMAGITRLDSAIGSGFYWRFDNDAPGARWSCNVNNGAGGISTSPSTISGTYASLMNIGIYLYTTSQAGQSSTQHVAFWYSTDGQNYFIDATFNTNIPTGGLAATSQGINTFRSAGTNPNATIFGVDWMGFMHMGHTISSLR